MDGKEARLGGVIDVQLYRGRKRVSFWECPSSSKKRPIGISLWYDVRHFIDAC